MQAQFSTFFTKQMLAGERNDGFDFGFAPRAPLRTAAQRARGGGYTSVSYARTPDRWTFLRRDTFALSRHMPSFVSRPKFLQHPNRKKYSGRICFTGR